MDRTVRAVVLLTLSYLAFGAYAFGVFLRQPLAEGEGLSVQAALGPLAYLACIVVGNVAIYRAVAARARRPAPARDDERLLARAIALLIFASFAAGLHVAGTWVEETLHGRADLASPVERSVRAEHVARGSPAGIAPDHDCDAVFCRTRGLPPPR